MLETKCIFIIHERYAVWMTEKKVTKIQGLL